VNGLSLLDAVWQRHLNVLRRRGNGNTRCRLRRTILLHQRQGVATAVGFEMDRGLSIRKSGGIGLVRCVIGSSLARVRATQLFLGFHLTRVRVSGDLI